jgi:hypothetical protein
MHAWLRSWFDYKEYVYYYKTVLVVMVASLFDIELRYNLGSIMKLIIEFMGVKFFVFNNGRHSKNLQKEVFFFIILQLLLMVLNLIIPASGYWNLIKKRLNSPIENKLKDILNNVEKDNMIKMYLINKKTGKIDIVTIVDKLLLFIYDFLKISIISFPVYRYIIFAPVV